jgi:hypothetical protein
VSVGMQVGVSGRCITLVEKDMREEERYGGGMHKYKHGRLTSMPSSNGQRNVPSG